MYLKKTIILSSVEGKNEKAVCNIEKKKDTYWGFIRLYNFEKEPSGILSLGFLSNKKIIKSGLTYKSKFFYTFKISEEIDLFSTSCALMNIAGGNAKPILYGSTTAKTMTESEERLISSLNILDEVLDINKVEKELNEKEIYLEGQEEVDEIIDKELNTNCDGKCANCKYREAFYINEEENTSVRQEEKFIEQIQDQLQILFNQYPEEDVLTKIFPNSKWVKIDYEDNGQYYVLGVIYENDIIKYVCYGIPGEYSQNPPEELKGFSKWLPIDTQNPNGFGYWISYQDAESGDNIEMNIV